MEKRLAGCVAEHFIWQEGLLIFYFRLLLEPQRSHLRDFKDALF